jgi:hypothetical protein
MPTVRDIAYEADGRSMIGSLGIPDQPGPRPAVLIAHEANGLDEYQKSRAHQLAELGYVAFALDYHGDGTPPEFSEAQARTGELSDDADRMRAIGRASLEVLLAEPATDPTRIAAIGYCFGGALMLELARPSGVRIRDARRERRLANAPLRRRRAHVHPPVRRRRRAPRSALRRTSGHAIVAGNARTVRRGLRSIAHSGARTSRGRADGSGAYRTSNCHPSARERRRPICCSLNATSDGHAPISRRTVRRAASSSCNRPTASALD